jgi:signal transduction histidine kinase
MLDIETVVSSVIRLVRQRASDHGHALNVDFGSTAGQRLLADERAVKQILFNLLSNAIKFTPDRGRITVSCRSENNYIRISVTDTGIGIPAELLETVMQPFERVDDTYTRRQEGTGLGLSLVDALVKAHGGTVTIESTVEIGTTVSVTLPGIGMVDDIAA